MYEDEFIKRLTELRIQKGVSARDMSLSIGQNPGYINNIETGKALPSMSAFFFICEYLDISPADFFDTQTTFPVEMNTLIQNLKSLNGHQLESISNIVEELARK